MGGAPGIPWVGTHRKSQSLLPSHSFFLTTPPTQHQENWLHKVKWQIIASLTTSLCQNHSSWLQYVFTYVYVCAYVHMYIHTYMYAVQVILVDLAPLYPQSVLICCIFPKPRQYTSRNVHPVNLPDPLINRITIWQELRWISKHSCISTLANVTMVIAIW